VNIKLLTWSKSTEFQIIISMQSCSAVDICKLKQEEELKLGQSAEYQEFEITPIRLLFKLLVGYYFF